MENLMLNRRKLLILGSLLPMALPGIVAAEPTCGGALSMSQKNRRRALGYLDVSNDPKRRCGLCSYFSEAEPGCGKCQMLSGGAVTNNSVCNSFVADTTKHPTAQ